MLFSIITVCYNSEKTIRRTIESLLKQSFTDFEYIIVDGASKDSTLDIIKEYQVQFNGRMRYISEPDKGIYDAMNKGIAMAQGDVIGIVNSDDFYEPDALLDISNAIDEKTDILYGMVRHCSNDGLQELRISRNNHFLLNCCNLEHPGVFVKKSCYQQHGVFDLQYKVFADYELMLRFSRKNALFKPVDKIVTNFSAGGVSGATPAYEMYQIRYRYGITNKFWYCAECAVEFFLKRILKR